MRFCRAYSFFCPTVKPVAKDPEGPLPRFPSQLHSAYLFNLTSYLADSTSFHSLSIQQIWFQSLILAHF